MARMKPFPKFLLIAIGVGVVVYGANLAIGLMPSKPAEVKADPVVTTTVPAESAQPVASAPPVQQAVEAPPVLQAAPTNDAGIANVLGATKK